MKGDPEKAKHFLAQQKIFRLADVMGFLACSVATARRRLKEWHVYSSYNKNASYYTLPHIPNFNEHQLWFYRNVCFSKYGTLKKTLEKLVENSTGGLNVIEISKIIAIPAHNILSQQMIQYTQFFREKHHGIYIYYSKDPLTQTNQKKSRKELNLHLRQFDLPSDAESVTILVELIRHPNDTDIQLSRRVQYRGISVSIARIRNLLIYHGLLKKNTD